MLFQRTTQRMFLTLMCLTMTLIASAAYADGFRAPFQDANAAAQSLAFTAQADNPSAVHYNPAGMTQLPGFQHSVGIQFVSPNTTFTSPTGVTVENDVGGPVGLPPPGQVFFTFNLNQFDIGFLRNLAIGLGLESLFGFANEYPANGPFSGALVRAQLPVIAIKPTFAYKVDDYLSLGLGADIYTFASFLGEGQSETQSIALGNIPGTMPGQRLELNGKGTTAGLNVSVLLTPLRNSGGKPLVNLGFIWRSQVVLPLDGELRADGALVATTNSSIKFPETFEWGLAWWPIRNSEREWKVESDLHWVRWQTIRNFDVTLSNGVIIPNPQSWHNALTVAFGTEYRWLTVTRLPDWEVSARAGYARSHTPVPDANFNPAFPDSNNHTLGIGVGFLCTGQGLFLGLIQCGQNGAGMLIRKAIELDLSFNAILWDNRTVTNAPAPLGINGTYKTRTYAGTFTVVVKF
ncbi:MAG: long-chain fatty acid transporter [Nitrospirae bacterium]|nr:MAG: long-chain fatty acid transporter [Nitrospirota bacterium]